MSFRRPVSTSGCNTPGWKNQLMVDHLTAPNEESGDRGGVVQRGRRPRDVDPAEGPLPPLLWPTSLVDRPRRPLVCYLDLNHWIGLSRANAGRADGERYVEALEACRAAKGSGTAIFPISDAHYVEMAKIRSESQRARLADVMWELSGLTTILSRPSIMRMELDRSLSDLVGPADGLLAPLPLLGFGSAWAFGRVGWRLRSDEEDFTDELEGDALARFRFLTTTAERRILAGPRDDEIPALKETGWDPYAGLRVAEQRALEEAEQAKRFDADPRWRRGRIRDVILARELVIELFDMLLEALTWRSLGLEFLEADRDRARRLVRSMPSSEISTELKRAAHRNRQTKWKSNDIIDIDAMSLAVPYCDVVVTERHRANQLRSAHFDDRMSTVILDTLQLLPDVLRST